MVPAVAVLAELRLSFFEEFLFLREPRNTRSAEESSTGASRLRFRLSDMAWFLCLVVILGDEL